MFTNPLIKPHPTAQWMDNDVLKILDYDPIDINTIYTGNVPTLEEFKNFPAEMVIAKCIKTTPIAVNDRPMTLNKGKDYFFDLLSFLSIYNVRKDVIRPTNMYKKKLKKYNGENLDKKQILCWMFSGGIGDVIFANPILRYIKEKYPTCYISMAIPFEIHSMVKQWDFVGSIYQNPFSAMPFYAADYHLVFDSLISKCKESETINAYELFAKWSGLDISKEKLIPIQRPDPKKVEKWKYLKCDIENESKTRDFVIVQLEANSIIRTPRREFQIQFLKKLSAQKIPIIIMDSPKRSQSVTDLIKACGTTVNMFNLSSFSEEVSDAIAVASLAKLVISVDTGMIHMAASVGTPVYGIYGAFPGSVRLSTYPKAKWIDGKSNCSPCYLHGFDLCRNSVAGYSLCYDNIDIDCLVKDIVDYWNQL